MGAQSITPVEAIADGQSLARFLTFLLNKKNPYILSPAHPAFGQRPLALFPNLVRKPPGITCFIFFPPSIEKRL